MEWVYRAGVACVVWVVVVLCCFISLYAWISYSCKLGRAARASIHRVRFSLINWIVAEAVLKMPLSENAEILDTAKGLVTTLQTAAGGKHAGFRPAHAHGHLLTGTFTPTPEAATLSKAYHFNNPVKTTTRFSSSGGLPDIPDTDPQANPRGIAIRFHLPDSSSGKRQHTDIIGHSTAFFPTRTGADFLEFLKRATTGGDVPGFLAEHPETVAFLQDPKPSPVSFATERFFGVNAFKYISADGKTTFVRNRIVPFAGYEVLSEEELKGKSKTYLFDELEERLGSGPVEFKLQAQIAEEGDVTDNATVHWPEERKIVELGTLKVEKSLGEEESKTQQKRDIFDPIPRVDGVEASDDPLLEVRANVYLVSGRERREA